MQSVAAAVDRLRTLAAIPEIDLLSRRFAEAGHELALVGGSVRDAFLDREIADLDFTTDARPDQILAIVAPIADAHWDIGREFGTIGARLGDHTVEITTYRSDAYDGETRKPVVAFGDELEGDLARRDFTVNAMALRLPDQVLVDPSGGVEDLLARQIRTPGAPEVSFGDDPLRMMRAARFTAQLGFAIDPVAFAAIRRMADRIGIVSAERVGDELTKLMLAPDPVAGIRALVDSGLAERGAAGDPGAAARDRRARPPQGRLRAQPDRARSGDRAREVARATSRTSSCASPCCCTTSASRRRARSSRTEP